ncbi:MAG: histidinol phosphate phosphatase domain-containing protein [Elusimicrobiota bacterium]|nr:histidinol phosphate phosphatase domain-containing protein [Elusimicrobiota bacterium]
MIDLHTHSFFSDGSLIPSELVFRAKNKGYEAIAITDHVDMSNLNFVIPHIVKVSSILTLEYKIEVIPGAELTYVPPNLISRVAEECRELGAKIILVHGETTVEPVPAGTNRAALEGRIDILSHPGRISSEEADLAKEKNVLLEITSRKGHSLTNQHVGSLAKKRGAKLIFNTDTHEPEDLITDEQALEVVNKAGMAKADLDLMLKNARSLINKALKGA